MKLRFTTIFLAVLAFTAVSSQAFAQKVQVCHTTGNGSFHLIVISSNALPAHLDHGDGQPGQAFPNMPGFIFGDNCTPTVVPPPELPTGCYTVNLAFIGLTIDIFYAGPIDIPGTTTDFFSSSNGTCSGTGFPDTAGFVAAGNATDAQTKCSALTAQLPGTVLGTNLVDLGTNSVPSEPGFWFCGPVIP